MKLSLIFVKLFAISALLIISNENLALHDRDSLHLFWDHYHEWLSGIFKEGVYITGYIVNANWLPETVGNHTEISNQVNTFSP